MIPPEFDYTAPLNEQFAYRLVAVYREEDLTNGIETRHSWFKRWNLDLIEAACAKEGLQSPNRFEMERSLPETDFQSIELRDTKGGGKATLKDITLTLGGKHKVHLLLVIPNKRTGPGPTKGWHQATMWNVHTWTME